MTARVYDVYGLALASPIALPFALAAAGRAPDLEVVWRGRSDAAPLPSAAAGRAFRADAKGWRLCYGAADGQWGALEYVRAERRLVLTGSSAQADFVQPLIGPAAAVLLREAGCCVLHGAAVARGGRALALLGPSGAGKSTLAAALIAAGDALVTDDVVAVWPCGDAPIVGRGPDVLSLGAEVAERFAGIGAMLGTRPSDTKLWLQPYAPRPSDGPARLDGLVILAPCEPGRASAAQTLLAPREATLALLRNLYGAGWIGAPGRADLEACARMASAVPVRRLQLPHDLTALASIARSLRDAASTP